MKKSVCTIHTHGSKFGGDEGDRTPDLCIANAALSQLSYTPEFCLKLEHECSERQGRVFCPSPIEIANFFNGARNF